MKTFELIFLLTLISLANLSHSKLEYSEPNELIKVGENIRNTKVSVSVYFHNFDTISSLLHRVARKVDSSISILTLNMKRGKRCQKLFSTMP